MFKQSGKQCGSQYDYIESGSTVYTLYLGSAGEEGCFNWRLIMLSCANYQTFGKFMNIETIKIIFGSYLALANLLNHLVQ